MSIKYGALTLSPALPHICHLINSCNFFLYNTTEIYPFLSTHSKNFGSCSGNVLPTASSFSLLFHCSAVDFSLQQLYFAAKTLLIILECIILIMLYTFYFSSVASCLFPDPIQIPHLYLQSPPLPCSPLSLLLSYPDISRLMNFDLSLLLSLSVNPSSKPTFPLKGDSDAPLSSSSPAETKAKQILTGINVHSSSAYPHHHFLPLFLLTCLCQNPNCKFLGTRKSPHTLMVLCK